MRRTTRWLLAALLGALLVPAGALAAGTVSTDSQGDITYTGDDTANVLTVTTSPATPPTAQIVFSETGIAKGTDTTNLCSATPDVVTCNFNTGGGDKLSLYGGDGDDQLTLDGPVGGYLDGGGGSDQLTGGDGSDSIEGGPQADNIDARDGKDFFAGGLGPDVVMGGEGDDYGFRDLGDGDKIDMGPGRDYFSVDNGDGSGDVLIGGSGTDTVGFYTVGDTGEQPFTKVDLAEGRLTTGAFGSYDAVSDTLTGIEDAGELAGQSGDDVLIGDASSNVLAGGNGNDTIVGGGGSDTLLGDKAYQFTDFLFEYGAGSDTIVANDGFQDDVACGGGADTVVADQFDTSRLSGCESVDTRQADPFGIAPQPQPQPQPQPAPDVRAPQCTLSKPGTMKTRPFVRHGFALSFGCDEPARVDATASVAVKRAHRGGVVLLRAGDLVLGQRSLDFGTGSRRLAFSVPRSLRKALGGRFTVRLRIDATDRAGNRSVSLATFKVR
jgi:hypothetical protein